MGQCSTGNFSVSEALQEIEQQRVDFDGPFLLDPVPGPFKQMTAAQPWHGATEEVQFTDEEANDMQRWNIFSNGRVFRVGDLKFDSLNEALAAATGLKNDGNGL